MNMFTWKWLAVVCLVNVVCTGCCIPVITGGNVDMDVYVANDPDDRLLGFEYGRNDRLEAIQRSERASRAIVISCYNDHYEKASPFRPAQVVTPTQNHVYYDREFKIAILILHTFYFATLDHRTYQAWIFTQDSWPVYMYSLRSSPIQLTAVWNDDLSGAKIPWGTNGATSTIIGYPLSRPWDKYVAAGAGCEGFELTEEDDPRVASFRFSSEKNIGDTDTLSDALARVPCAFIKSVDDAKSKLTDEDRLLVFRQTLLMYEQTQSYWDSDKRTEHDRTTTRREAYERNTRLLQERIDALEAKGRK